MWFPCVLWNCIRPEQLWCLNPKKILDRGKKFKSQFNNGAKGKELCGKTSSQKQDDIPRDSRETSASDFSTTDEGNETYQSISWKFWKFQLVEFIPESE